MFNKVKLMAGAREKFTTDQVIRAIRDGEMPDGREMIHDDEAYLKEVAAALKSLDPNDLDEVLEATGCDVAAVEMRAEEFLSDLKPMQSDPARAISSWWHDPVPGFSLAREVCAGVRAAMLRAARECGAVVVLGHKEKTEVHKKAFVIDGIDGLPINGQLPISGPPPLAFMRRDRHIDGD